MIKLDISSTNSHLLMYDNVCENVGNVLKIKHYDIFKHLRYFLFLEITYNLSKYDKMSYITSLTRLKLVYNERSVIPEIIMLIISCYIYKKQKKFV